MDMKRLIISIFALALALSACKPAAQTNTNGIWLWSKFMNEVNLDSLAIATSGSYRKFKEVEGKKVRHIINPKTGRSEESMLLSVSIVAPDCMTADAWATACMAMGLEKTQGMMEKNNSLGVMTISADEQGNFVVWSNKRFAQLVKSN